MSVVDVEKLNGHKPMVDYSVLLSGKYGQVTPTMLFFSTTWGLFNDDTFGFGFQYYTLTFGIVVFCLFVVNAF